MPRKLDFATSSRRRKRRGLRERMAEMEDSIKAADGVLADPTATAATKGRLIAARQGWRDTLRELRGELQGLSGRRQVTQPDATSLSSTYRKQPGLKRAESGQEAAEPELWDAYLLHPKSAADAFYRLAVAVETDILLNDQWSPDSEALASEYGEEPLRAFTEAYEAATKAEQEGLPWEPPAIPTPLSAGHSDIAEDEPRPAAEADSTATSEARETASGTMQGEPVNIDAAPEAAPPSRPLNGQQGPPVGRDEDGSHVRSIVWRDGVPCSTLDRPGTATGSNGLPLDPAKEEMLRDMAETARRKREKFEKTGGVVPGTPLDL